MYMYLKDLSHIFKFPAMIHQKPCNDPHKLVEQNLFKDCCKTHIKSLMTLKDPLKDLRFNFASPHQGCHKFFQSHFDL